MTKLTVTFSNSANASKNASLKNEFKCMHDSEHKNLHQNVIFRIFPASLDRGIIDSLAQDRHYSYNLILRRVHETIVAVEKQ